MSNVTMQYRPLGRCGAKVSVLGLGAWTTFGGSVDNPRLVRSIMHAAFEAGVNFFDAADIYAKGQAERMMGKVFADFPRHKLVVSTKLFWPMSDDINDRGLSRKHIRESVEASLKRLGTDYIDVYFCHRFDDGTPLEETARAMDDLVHQGKILYWGTSEWSGAQLLEAAGLCRELGLYRPQVEQPRYSLLARRRFEAEIRPAAEELGMGQVVWSPLASGLLTGKYDRGIPEGSRLSQMEWLREGLCTDKNLALVRRFKAVADGLEVSRAQLALAWAAAQPGVSCVITGATRLEQLRENLGALDVRVSAEVARKLDAIFPCN